MTPSVWELSDDELNARLAGPTARLAGGEPEQSVLQAERDALRLEPARRLDDQSPGLSAEDIELLG